MSKIGRNEPCPCGSGKKYKNCCYSKDHSLQITTNFSVDLMPEDADFITNRKGAIIYKDELLQPRMQFAENAPVTCKVLSVGFTKQQHPIATIQESGGVVAYVLPDAYISWCKTCVAMAMSGKNIFPSTCRFILQNGNYFVDVL